jgi:hypothetical protein
MKKILFLVLLLALASPVLADGFGMCVGYNQEGQLVYFQCQTSVMGPFHMPPPPDPWSGSGVGPSCAPEGEETSSIHQCTRTVGGVPQDGIYYAEWICFNGRWTAVLTSRCL